MSDKIEHLSTHRRKKKPGSIADAVKRATQHIRNVGADGREEPEGFASGDMEKFLEDPEIYEKENDDDGKE